MIAQFTEIEAFARQCFEQAETAATAIQFSVLEQYSRKSASLGGGEDIKASHIGNEPEFAVLDNAYGMAAWAVILSVDLRGSSVRAMAVGPKDTYLTMHTYLPTMAELVSKAGGKIVGLRGDGLFASFGLTKLVGTKREVTPEVSGNAIQNASQCGKAMLEATDEIINDILTRNDIEGGLRIGVGIDVGDIVVTRIGLRDANEVTAYGPPVNQACKDSGKTSEILMTPGARSLFPQSDGGRVRFHQSSHGFSPRYPADMFMLARQANPIGKRNPR